MPTIKRKMSASAWILVALAVIAIIALPILHVFEIVDLSFIGDGFMNILAWGATDTLNGALMLGGVFIGGALFYYTIRTYFIGTQVPVTTVSNYNPIGQTISNQPQQKQDVEVTE